MAIRPFLFVFIMMGMANLAKGVEILKISKSGKSLILNIGMTGEIEVGERRRLYAFDGLGTIAVAELRAVRVAPSYSYWIVERVNEGGTLRRNRDYQLEFSNDSSTRIHYKINVGPADKIQYEEDGLLEEDISLEDLLPPPVEGTEVIDDVPFIGNQKKYVDEYNQNLTIIRPDFSKKTANIKRIKKDLRDEQFSYDTDKKLLYKLDINEKAPENYLYSEYDRALQPKSLVENSSPRPVVASRAKDKIEREGPLWSKGMSQEELIAYMRSTGLAQEKEFLEKSLYELYNHEITLTSITSGDLEMGQESSFGLEYEYLLGRTSAELKSMTIGGLYKVGAATLYLSGSLIEIDRSMIGGNIRYYFFNKPYSVKKYMLFLGTGFALGSGKIHIKSQETSLDHSVTSSMFNIGVKYRFLGEEMGMIFKGWGLSFLLGQQNIKYLVYNDTVDESLFTGTITTLSHYFALGVSLYF